jgi:WD40 repeat protein
MSRDAIAPREPRRARAALTRVRRCADGEVRLWDLEFRRPVVTLRAHQGNGGALAVAALGDGARLLSQGREGRVKVWDVATLRASDGDGAGANQSSEAATAAKSANSLPLRAVETSPVSFCRVATCAEEPELFLAPSPRAENTLLLHDARLPRAAMEIACEDARLPPDARVFGSCMSARLLRAAKGGPLVAAAGGEGGLLRAYDCRAPQRPLCELRLHSEPLLAFDIDPARLRAGDGATLGVSGSAGKGLVAFELAGDMSSGRALGALPGSEEFEGFADVAARRDGAVLASGGWDHRVRVFSLRSLKPLALLRFHTQTVGAVAWAPDEARMGLLASGGKEGLVALWKLYPPAAPRAAAS